MNQPQKVPLRVKVDGKKIDIGEAVVEIDGDYISVTAICTDEKYSHLLKTGYVNEFSVGELSHAPILEELPYGRHTKSGSRRLRRRER